MSVVHVGHIKSALQNRFHNLIDLSDVSKLPPDQVGNFFLTRSLAAYALSQVAQIDDTLAASAVCDGSGDNGIDAFYFDGTERTAYIVQSKWIHSGNGSVEVGEIQKFVQGCKDLLEARFDRFSGRLRKREAEVMAVLEDSLAKFVLVIAYPGLQSLSDAAKLPLDDLLADLNDLTELVTLQVLRQAELHAAISKQALGESVTLEIMLHEYGQTKEPYAAYYGQVDVADIANWAKFGHSLYRLNLRKFKGSTDVNEGITETLRSAPEKFWYFNNGITILCSHLGRKPMGGTRRTSGVFVCEGASVVNGAQTVGSITAAFSAYADQVQSARVLVRLISLEHCPPGFATELTRAANTQNRIEKKDFAALDPQQERLKTDLWLEAQKEYAYKTGDAVPPPDQGCTLDDAAVALACAQSDTSLCVLAKREVTRLYENIETAPYTALFNPSTTALRLWRSVQISRLVDSVLKDEQKKREGKERLIAVHGNRFILHVVFRRVETGAFDDPTVDFENVRYAVSQLTPTVLTQVTTMALTQFPTAYPSNLFKNASKCKELAISLSTQQA